MDTNASTGRLLAFTTANPPTLQTSGSSPGPQYRRHSSGSESGSSSDQGVVEHSQSAQQPQPDFDAQRARFEAENQPFNSARHFANASATIYVDDSPYIPPESPRNSQNYQYAQTGAQAQYTAPYFNYHAQMASSVAHTSPHPLPQRHNSGGSSPSESARSTGSDGSGHRSSGSQGSVSSRASDHDNQYSNEPVPIEESFHVQEPQGPPASFNPERYPAYDASARRIGMEHVRYETLPHDASGQSYYRARTMQYPNQDEGPHVMSMSLDSPTSPDMALFARSEAPPVSLPPATPQIDYNTRPMALNEAHTPYYMPPSQPRPLPAMSHSLLPAGHSFVPDLPDPSPNLRQLLGLGEDEEVSLNSLADPPPGEKPNYPYPTLIKLAIHGSPKKRLTLQEIYAALEERFQWFRDNASDKAWQNSIRHNLSLNKCFRRVNKPITEPGKGSYWMVDYSQGEGNKRERKRNKRPTKAELARRAKEAAASHPEQSSSSDEDQGSSARSRSGTAGPGQTSAPAARSEETNIDPALRNEGHIVGEGRVRTNAAARSNARRANSPYVASSSSPQGSSQNRGANSPGQMAAPTTVPQTSMTRVSRQTSSLGQVAFGQPAFGQSSFSSWPSNFSATPAAPASTPARMGQSAWNSMAPMADTSSGQTNALMNPAPAPGMSVDMTAGRTTRSMSAAAAGQAFDIRYAPIRPATPRGGLGHVGGPSGLVTARRVGAGASALGAAQQYPRIAHGQGARRASDSSSSSQE